MDTMTWFFTGGFLKGYRTYVLSSVGIATALGQYSIGDANLTETVQAISLAMSVGTARAAIAPK
jgi:hypothetical protein